ncbi:MAG TPA: choice-of-anchor tandem repeat GloVer-containing protein [Pirellulales bacterium]|jgi:uncharacterized repeat protein (TIGR03803 family)|nr:choice-of-anchor tandem repeat GloVer-containing protein [Pirellulales bacterium]
MNSNRNTSSRHDDQSSSSPARRTRQLARRAARFERLESREMLTASAETLHSLAGPADYGTAGAVTVVGSTIFGTAAGGADGDGVLYSMNAGGSNYQVLHTFTGSGGDGASPVGGLTLVGSTLYGVTSDGGSGKEGTIFSINTDGSDYQVLHAFAGDGGTPTAGLTLSGDTLYGTEQYGGQHGAGAIFSINTSGADFQSIYSFGGTYQGAIWPTSPLVVSGSTIYGETPVGGVHDDGTIFSVGTNGSGYNVLYTFNTSDGGSANGLTLVGSTLYGTTRYGGSINSENGTLFSINTDGSDYTTLHSFGGANDGFAPVAGLTLIGSTLYGTTEYGGVDNNGAAGPYPTGSIFSINLNGSDYQVLYTFQNTNGTNPGPNSALTADGSALIGITSTGGTSNTGTVFSATVALPAIAITPSGNVPLYGLGSPPVAVDSGLAISSANATLTGATVTLGDFQAGDVFHFTNQDGISGSYAGGVLTLSGTASVAQYQAAFQSVTFSTTSTNASTRWISIAAADGTDSSNAAQESIDVVVAPTVSGSGNSAFYTLGTAGVVLDPGFSVQSADGEMTGATLSIGSTGLQTGDVLHFTNQNGISGSYAGGVLTLSGTATAAQYQAALRSVTFSTTSTSGDGRPVTVVVSEGSLSSEPIMEVIDTLPAPAPTPPATAPVVTWSGSSTEFFFGGPASQIGGIMVQSTGNVTGATITISPGTLQPGDTLNFTSEYGITGSYANGVLTLTGTAAPESYEVTINSITFSTTSTSTVSRELLIVASDGSLASAPSTEWELTQPPYTPPAGGGKLVSVSPVLPLLPVQIGTTISGSTGNQDSTTPTVSGSGNSAFYHIGGAPVVLDPGFTVTSGGADLTGAQLTIASSALQSGDVLHFTNQNGIIGSYAGGVLTLSGTATPAQYQVALRSVTFSTTSNYTSGRPVSVVVSDGAQTSDPITEVIDSIPAPGTPTPTPTPTGPTVSGSGNSAFYQIGGVPVAVDPGFTVTSGGADLTGAKLAIASSALQPDDVLNFTNQNGITGSYAGGVLTLSGTATPAQYQAALRSVTFSTTSDYTSGRPVSVVVSDGAQMSDPITEVIDSIPATTGSGASSAHALATKAGAGFTPLALGSIETVTYAPASVVTNFNFAPFNNSSTTGSSGSSSHVLIETTQNKSTTTPTIISQHGRHLIEATDAAIADFDLSDLYL